MGKSLPRIPHPHQLELLMEDLGTLGKSLPRIPPHKKNQNKLGGLKVKGYQEYPPSAPPPHPLKLLMEDSGDWCVETNRCIRRGYRPVCFVARLDLQSCLEVAS